MRRIRDAKVFDLVELAEFGLWQCLLNGVAQRVLVDGADEAAGERAGQLLKGENLPALDPTTGCLETQHVPHKIAVRNVRMANRHWRDHNKRPPSIRRQIGSVSLADPSLSVIYSCAGQWQEPAFRTCTIKLATIKLPRPLSM